MVNLHHVNLGVPVGGVDAESKFLVDVLHYHQISDTAEFSTTHWFESEDGKQIHLSEDPDHRPAARAHVAIEMGDELAELERTFEQSGYEFTASNGIAHRTVFCCDPAGNRWELRGSLPA